MSPSTCLIRAPRYGLRLSFSRWPACSATIRSLATVHTTRDRILHDAWFNGTPPHYIPSSFPGGEPQKPRDPRTVKLGKTLRILQERLPTLLQSPLPQEILSPQITLRLFPSTHSHLPTVSGRVAYIAALWSSPIAWGRLPLVGNVKLEILSERIIKNTSSSTYSASEYRPEKLIVRWRTCGNDKIKEFLGAGKGGDREFTGLFIFEFDDQGRIVTHTIEHVQEGGNWETGVGAKVVGLTDWLLGGLKGRGEPGATCPAFWSPGRKP